MTVRFENCSDPVADQGGSAQIRVGRSPDLCYPWESPLLHRFFSTTEHTEAASRHTEDTEPKPPAPLFPLSRFLQGNQGSSKNRDKDASMLFNVRGPYRPPPALRTGMQILTGK